MATSGVRVLEPDDSDTESVSSNHSNASRASNTRSEGKVYDGEVEVYESHKEALEVLLAEGIWTKTGILRNTKPCKF
jgi:hypothetical protein